MDVRALARPIFPHPNKGRFDAARPHPVTDKFQPPARRGLIIGDAPGLPVDGDEAIEAKAKGQGEICSLDDASGG
jgi:hypothetical protein